MRFDGILATGTLQTLALHLVAFGLGFGLCRVALPWVIAVAHRRGWLDLPGERRAHAHPVPRLGGVAIIASVALAFALATLLSRWAWNDGAPLPLGGLLAPVLLGCAMVVGVGVADDLVGVSPRVKLLVQVGASIVVIVGGFVPNTMALTPGGPTVHLGSILSIGVTVLWLVGITNAFNLIDGIDGLAGAMGMVAIATCLAVDLLVSPGMTATLSLALAGAVLAFLRLNWHPARVFLGDAGSMTLGFFLAIRTVVAATDAQGVTYPLVPLAALAYPLVDTFVAMARRWVRGHPLSRADGRHVHHQLRALGFAPPRAVQLLIVFFAAVAVFGVTITFAPWRLAAAMALGGGVVLFAVAAYGVRFLGYVEFLEVGASIASVVRNARLVVNEKLRAADTAQRIRKAETLDEVRTILGELVEETRLLDVELLSPEDGERRMAPPNQQLSPPSALPVRLEYPFLWHSAEGTRIMVMRLWCARPVAGAHPIAERMGSRIGPALDEWFVAHAAIQVQKQRRPHSLIERPQ